MENEILAEQVVEGLIAKRDYDILVYFLVSTVEDLVKTLKRTFHSDEETLRKLAIQFKKATAEKIIKINICPYCLSRDVKIFDNKYICQSCGNSFQKGWKDERLADIIMNIYLLLRSKGLNGREAKDHVYEIFGIKPKSAGQMCSEMDVLNLVYSTFLILYDDPLVRSRFLIEAGETKSRGSKEIKSLKLDDDDTLVLNVLKGKKGLSYADISRETGLSYSKVRRSVKWLLRFGLVEVKKRGNRCIVFLKCS